ncbi:MAG TPA: phosphotransferase, partial [Humisphaera sp.]
VNGQWVFRFPRRQFAVPFMEAESRLLPWLAGRLPVPIPAPPFVGRPTGAFPWPFAGYRLIAGRTACRANLSRDQRLALAAPLGRFLRALHATDAAEARRFGATGDTIGRLDVARRRPAADARLNDAVAAGLVADAGPIRAALDAAPADYRPRSDTLLQGDLYARHVVVDDAGDLAGVIDWGDAHVGDPATDLMVVYALLPAAARPAFFDAYGPVDELTLRVARWRAASHTLAVVAYAADIADADLLREGKAALANLAEA